MYIDMRRAARLASRHSPDQYQSSFDPLSLYGDSDSDSDSKSNRNSEADRRRIKEEEEEEEEVPTRSLNLTRKGGWEEM